MSDPKIHKHDDFSKANLSDYYDCIEFFDNHGVYLADDWQKEVLKDWLAIHEDNGYLHRFAGLSVPRQNGKSLLLEMRIIFGILFLGEDIVFSAHEVRTSRKIFERISDFLEDPRFPDVKNSIRSIRKTNGQEEILVKSSSGFKGGSVSFMARTKGSGRGQRADVLIFDEAQQLKAAAMPAMRPLLTTSKRPQTIMVGTPVFDAIEGEVFKKRRSGSIEEDGTSRSSWIEFSADDGDDIDSVDVWAKSNPAFAAGRIMLSTIEDDRTSLSEADFKMERLGMWSSASGVNIINYDVWKSLGDADSTIPDMNELIVSVDVSPLADMATVSVAGFTAQEKIQVEVLRNQQYTSWVLPYMIRIRNAGAKIHSVILDSTPNTATIVDELKRHGFHVVTTSAKQLAQSSVSFIDMVNEGKIVHLGQPELDSAITGARKRKLLDSFAFSRSTATTDITPLISCALAVHGVNRFLKENNGVVDGVVDQYYNNDTIMVIGW